MNLTAQYQKKLDTFLKQPTTFFSRESMRSQLNADTQQFIENSLPYLSNKNAASAVINSMLDKQYKISVLRNYAIGLEELAQTDSSYVKLVAANKKAVTALQAEIQGLTTQLLQPNNDSTNFTNFVVKQVRQLEILMKKNGVPENEIKQAMFACDILIDGIAQPFPAFSPTVFKQLSRYLTDFKALQSVVDAKTNDALSPLYDILDKNLKYRLGELLENQQVKFDQLKQTDSKNAVGDYAIFHELKRTLYHLEKMIDLLEVTRATGSTGYDYWVKVQNELKDLYKPKVFLHGGATALAEFKQNMQRLTQDLHKNLKKDRDVNDYAAQQLLNIVDNLNITVQREPRFKIATTPNFDKLKASSQKRREHVAAWLDVNKVNPALTKQINLILHDHAVFLVSNQRLYKSLDNSRDSAVISQMPGIAQDVQESSRLQSIIFHTLKEAKKLKDPQFIFRKLETEVTEYIKLLKHNGSRNTFLLNQAETLLSNVHASSNRISDKHNAFFAPPPPPDPKTPSPGSKKPSSRKVP